MNYRFIIDYTPTDPQGATSQRECLPLYGDDISVTKNMESDEWFLRRKLDGKMTFVRGDFDWIMGCDFDGTFKMTVQSSTDGTNWYDYLTGSFSRANLEIDEDNQRAVLNGISEGDEYNVIENGKKETYDLMKVIPDGDAKEVQGQVHPALAMVDYRSTTINKSDIFCGGAATGGGYKENEETGWNTNNKVVSDEKWYFNGNVYTEAQVKMKANHTEANGLYAGILQYSTTWSDAWFPVGTLTCNNGYRIVISTYRERDDEPPFAYLNYRRIRILDSNDNELFENLTILGMVETSPAEIVFDYTESPGMWVDKLSIMFHYIRATLLTQSGGNADNVLDTGDYYKRMAAFNNQDGGLSIAITTNTVEQPNGHRLLPGTGEQGTTPMYFAPPDESHDWIPLAEYGWQYASMWYTITPSVDNGLLDESKIGTFRWTRCWTLGTCLNRLLRKITDNKVTFDESAAGSEFLYATVNPVTNGEPFEYLFTQKSNVMNPGGGDSAQSAARCNVTLDWFLEFMRNGLNLYWWLEPRNGGTYAFRVEHVEWFRRGGSYTGQLNAQINLTEIKPRRNFLRNGDAAKHLDDQLHKYTYDMQGMTEKYTFSWQGDGGSDAFKGNPMIFRAGWIEKGSSESHEVDNIFADLAWLMLNAGSDTASSKNYEGIFAFSGYLADATVQWKENSAPTLTNGYWVLTSGRFINALYYIWLTMPQGMTATVTIDDLSIINPGPSIFIGTWTGTGEPQVISLNDRSTFQRTMTLRVLFSGDASQVTIHRIHALTGQVYNVPNVDNLLDDGYLQNGPLAWPWLQNEYLHYDVPARRWGFKADSADELDNIPNGWLDNGTVKLCKKQEVPLLPLPTKSDEDSLDKGVIGGLRDSNNQLQTGIVKEAKINLSSRNASLTLMYDMIS